MYTIELEDVEIYRLMITMASKNQISTKMILFWNQDIDNFVVHAKKFIPGLDSGYTKSPKLSKAPPTLSLVFTEEKYATMFRLKYGK